MAIKMSNNKTNSGIQLVFEKIDESIMQIAAQKIAKLKAPVNIRVFTSKDQCIICNEMKRLIEEIKSFSDKISVVYHEWDPNDSITKKYDITHHHTLTIEGDKDYGIRFIGVPLGSEFETLIESLIFVSNREPQISPRVNDMLLKLDKKANLKVFVSLKCPHCPAMVLISQKLALASDKVHVEMIVAPHARDLAIEYNIQSYPTTIINNGFGYIVGVVPEDILLKLIFEAYKRRGDTLI